MSIVIVLTAVGSSVFLISPVEASQTCQKFGGWSIESENGDSSVITGLTIDTQEGNIGSGEYALYEDGDQLTTFDSGSSFFVTRSKLKSTTGGVFDDGTVNLKIMPTDPGFAIGNCGGEKNENEDFSFGPKTSVNFTPERTSVKVVG